MKRLLVFFHQFEDAVLTLLVGSMVVIACGQIILRNFFSLGFIWADPLIRHLVLWIGFWGAMIAAREGKHIQIDAILHFLPTKIRLLSGFFSFSFAAIICIILTYAASHFIVDEKAAGTHVFLDIPAWQVQLILPLAFAVLE